MKSFEFMGNRDEELEGQLALDAFIEELEYNGFRKVEDNYSALPPIVTKTLKRNTSIELTINTM
jgi:hypothetical protein